jgi:hypothetical protein
LVVAFTLLGLLIALATWLPSRGQGQAAPEPVRPEPMLGAGGFGGMKLMGAVGAGAPGEVWGYRVVPPQAPAPVADGRALEWGPGASERLAFVRYTAATDWQLYDSPLDAQGQPFPGVRPYTATTPAGRMTASGAGAVIGPALVAGSPVVGAPTILARDPGGRFRALPQPPTPLLGLGEALGSPSRAPLGVFEQGGHASVLAAPVGRRAEDAILVWDGGAWSAEPVCAPHPAGAQPPAGCRAFGTGESFKVLALSAAGRESAWLLGLADPQLGRGIVLMHRVEQGGERRWVEQPLDAGGAHFADAQPVGGEVQAVAPLQGRADPLTATSDGVWVDGSFELAAGGTTHDFTLHVSADGATRSWCDPSGICDHSLGAGFSRAGYMSFAWDGPGAGQRVITNPLEPGAGESSNRGTWLRLEGETFVRQPGAGWVGRTSGAFLTPDDGWLEGPVRVPGGVAPQRLARWPVPSRRPLTAVTAEPGTVPGALGTRALAVGDEGSVLRFEPGQGWNSEFLLTSSGAVAKPRLRAVAWPEPGRAHAVGDAGAMWLWRAETGLWERDPGAPLNFDAQLTGVAFEPGEPERGYAIGRSGTLLDYGKSWEPETPPPGFESRDFTAIAFAGSQALVAAGEDLLVNDGAGWRVDRQAHDLLRSTPQPGRLLTVSGLPDGGAVAAGDGIVIARDSEAAPWHFADQPLPGMVVVAAGAFRDGGRVRAVVSVLPNGPFPPPDVVPEPDPNVRPSPLPALALPWDGYVLRETQHGWRDEQRNDYGDPGVDKPVKPDPILAFSLGPAGDGWAVGGWSGGVDAAERGSQSPEERRRVQTAGIYRYSSTTPAGTVGAGPSPIPLDPGPVRFAVGGHAECSDRCADLAPLELAPDRTLALALSSVGGLTARPDGPRFFLYTGARVPPGVSDADEQGRYAQLLRSAPGLGVYATPAEGDTADGGAAFGAAFASAPAPFGVGLAPDGVGTDGIPGALADPASARTHYAFDSRGPAGMVRVVVIDNSAGSLAASDPHQNPHEQQLPWLISVLDDARAKGIPAIVVGSRDLNPRFQPSLNAASDGQGTAEVLRDHGASAYLFDRPEETRASTIPSASSDTIPTFGTGTLGYRSSAEASDTRALSVFGDPAYLIVELDARQRDPLTNRAPVHARLIPVAEDLSLEAVDGTVLRRSRQALFRGLARRPVAGDRWGGLAGESSRSPAGSDPHTDLPGLCSSAGCSTALQAEYRFSSSDPDIGDFVRQDPASSNPRKPALDQHGKVIGDSQSSLLCAFNAGTTTVTVASGGLSYSRSVRVLGGSVLRPCGTRPLSPDRFVRRTLVRNPDGAGAPPPPPLPPALPPVALVPPPPLVAVPLPPLPRPPLPPLGPDVPPPPPPSFPVPAPPPPPRPLSARPTPPGGSVARVYQVEEKREEEVALEESQAFARYEHDDGGPGPLALLPALVLLAAIAGAGTRSGLRGRGTRAASAAAGTPPRQPAARRRSAR